MSLPQGIRGVLLDVDGTLLAGHRAIAGAAEAVERIRRARVVVRFTTNTTRRPRSSVAGALDAAGIRADTSEVLAPAILARRRILDSKRTRASLLVPEGSREDFDGVQADDDRPDWVVVGDLGPEFTFERLNRAFHALRAGAGLIALQKNRAWDAGERGILLDAGPFVAALEYAARVEAEVVGKPSREFFELALSEVGLGASEVLVVGDGVETDGIGAAAAGCCLALVCTGRFDPADLARSGIRPDLLLDSIASL